MTIHCRSCKFWGTEEEQRASSFPKRKCFKFSGGDGFSPHNILREAGLFNYEFSFVEGSNIWTNMNSSCNKGEQIFISSPDVD